MPYIVAAMGAIAAIYFFVIRARNAADIASELVGAAADVQAAARRFGFRRRANIHPVEAVDDPNVAATLVAVSFLELDDYPTDDAKTRLIRALQTEFDVSVTDAEELCVLGRWLMTECQGPQPALTRGARRLYKLTGANDFTALMTVLSAIAPENGLTDRQRDALDDLKRAFKIR